MPTSPVLIRYELLQLLGSFGEVGIPDEVEESFPRLCGPVLAGDGVSEILDSRGVGEAEACAEDGEGGLGGVGFGDCATDHDVAGVGSLYFGVEHGARCGGGTVGCDDEGCGEFVWDFDAVVLFAGEFDADS